MDFSAIILFLTFYYVRPQEWLSLISSLHLVTLSMAMGLIAIATRDRKLELKDFFRTPHDWVMYALIGWIVYASPTPMDTWGEVKSYLVFYLVIVHTLINLDRIRKFLFWWTGLIILLAVVGIASENGFDPLDSHYWTVVNQGRLCINLSLFCNPNAVGHNIVPGLFMAYFALIWARPIFMKQVGVFVMAIPAYCIYMTLSKGAFLSGFVSGTLSLTFGRPLVMKILILWAALTIGWAAVFQLPRMQGLSKTRSDPGIVQRVMLWHMGLDWLERLDEGVGYMRWWEAMYQKLGWIKAPHCSYVQIGGELGYNGLFLHLAVIYCCLRTLVTSRTANDEEERARRMLFVLVVSYAVSSWMIDFAYRPTYFMFAAVVAAYHRLIHFRPVEFEEPVADESVAHQLRPVTPGGMTLPLPAIASVMASPAVTPVARRESGEDAKAAAKEPLPQGIRWNRFGVIDFCLVWTMTYMAIRFWKYAVKNM